MENMQKQTSSSSQHSKYVKNMEKLSRLAGFDHQNAIIFSVLTEGIKELEKKLSVRIKKLERSIDNIENYIEERTGLEPGKELTDSSESSSTDNADEDWYEALKQA